MLDAAPPDLDGARETARRTIRDGNRASEVITRLRALFSKREFTLEPLDLNEVTREVITLSSNDLQRNRMILQSELADGLPIVTGDRIQLQQVIMNLLRNASDAMVDVHDRPRQLLIRTKLEDDQVRLTVRDAGVGVTPQSMDSLFDAFYTTKSGGMGIGLFVSRSIVERHHGRLWAEPTRRPRRHVLVFHSPQSRERPGHGTRESAMIATNTKVLWTSTARVMHPQRMAERPLVSVVDDDESVRESLPDLLRQFGFAAQAFSSAEAFLGSENVEQTRCLIVDIGMPGMSGPDLQRELAHRQRRIPIVFITASDDRAVRPRLLAEGAVECLFKPFSEAALLDAINAGLRMR